MRKILFLSLILVACTTTKSTSPKTALTDIKSAPDILTDVRQLTFSGKRAGEGYFSPDGSLMIFQSERDTSNPFYQMYVMSMKDNKVTRVSPGYGKTTCGWIHPSKTKVIFASTQDDPLARQKQQAELDFRKSGQTRRYSWDYDENYEIFSASIRGGNYKNLTRTLGYDAEGSISPDGQWIVFSSNRHAYSASLSPEDKALLEKDTSYFLDLYIMDINGNNVRRLTQEPGYDGGPFFSPDGDRIVWRRFSRDGVSAEVYTMKTDGSDVTQVTRLSAMTWAPFYHPSNDYIVFTSNLYGFSNFELFIVDTLGKKNPIRVTNSEGFDGLPVFTPDGKTLTWNKKLANGDSQIFSGNWDDGKARALLGLPKQLPMPGELSPSLSQSDAKSVVEYLSSADMAGRATGSSAEDVYSRKIANFFRELNLAPTVGNQFIQSFPFASDVRMGSRNSLVQVSETQTDLKLNVDWRPVKFSKIGETSSAPVVFAGYGIVAPATPTQASYDSYAGLDIKDKWVIVFRYTPEDVSRERKDHLMRYSRLEHKLAIARQNGARGIIFASGPHSRVKEDLVPFGKGASSETSIPAISVSDKIVTSWLEKSGHKLSDVQRKLDKEEAFSGFEINNIKLAANIDLIHTRGEGKNVIATLKVPGATQTLVIGAHGDHLGSGKTESSLMNSKDTSDIHYGADDNASGVAGVLELAHYFKTNFDQKKIKLKQNLVFAIWSGEELGNLGSSFYLKSRKSIRPRHNAYLNMDMIGRLSREKGTGVLSVQGTGSSKNWQDLIEQSPKNVPIALTSDPYLPTDAMSFYLQEVPVLSFFTGAHSDYHTPRDTAEKIDYAGLISTVELVKHLAETISTQNMTIAYEKVAAPSSSMRRGFRIFLGTIPDYAQDSKKVAGVRINGVIKDGPAEKAGLKAGDIIVEFSNLKIENLHDYVYSMESARAGEATKITVLRGSERVSLSITPQAKE